MPAAAGGKSDGFPLDILAARGDALPKTLVDDPKVLGLGPDQL